MIDRAAALWQRHYPRHWLHLSLAVWGCSFIILGGYPLAVMGRNLEWWFFLWLPLVVFGGAGLSIILSLIVLRTEKLHWLPQFAALLGAISVISFVQSVFAHGLWAIFQTLTHPDYRNDWVNGVAFNLLIYVWIFGLYVTGLKFLLLQQRARERDAEMARARAAAGRAELAALRYQIQPEVLFTTLSSASDMVESGRSAEAADLVDRLSGFMRGQLSGDAEAGSTLGGEIDALDAFVALERSRTGASIEIEIDCPEELEDISGPPFLLQPVMEIRLRHVLSEPKGILHIQIVAECIADRLRIAISDDGSPQAKADFADIGNRLRRIDARAKFEVDSHPFSAVFDLSLQ